ncbi:MAG TPA: EamA family transporter RarD [Candidatus Avacidaminococcus intestinavium]|uniref:EamA family transporter RarD n=1 Tax=Candidatus Avacidaminococcus intestinavium TaxID=2840684 RepID=A0A9D1MR84_9FIRM|nr:EamA family transporter RarD [Candidatus Avacidaminococcus intestinavium]
MRKQSEFMQGIFYTLTAYLLWGILPVYWKSIYGVDAFEILSWRVIWSVVFVGLVIIGLGRWKIFCTEVKKIMTDKGKMVLLALAGTTIMCNWGIFIWAVSNGHIIETSMGYYINPLVSILIGVLYLKEKLNNLMKLSIMCAGIGVAVMIFSIGVFPWISLSLAISFAFYGLIKKTLVVETLTGILLETLLVSPLACLYLYWLAEQGGASWQNVDWLMILLLIGAGIVTAIPLIMFTAGAKLLPLSIIGFLQYISPTISLLLGIFIYGEHFSANHLYAFTCIWIGLVLFSYSQIKNR